MGWRPRPQCRGRADDGCAVEGQRAPGPDPLGQMAFVWFCGGGAETVWLWPEVTDLGRGREEGPPAASPQGSPLPLGALPQAPLWLGCLVHGPPPSPRPRSPCGSRACVLTLTWAQPGLSLFGHVAYAVSVGYHPRAAGFSPVARELPPMPAEAMCLHQQEVGFQGPGGM